MIRSYLPLLLIFGVSIVVAFGGCDGFRNNSGVSGRLQVFLTDTPTDAFDEVLVTIDRVELIGNDAAGESMLLVLNDMPQEFDLLQLQEGIAAQLADAQIPGGRYDRLRLIVGDDADVRLVDGSRVIIPSTAEAGLKVTFPPIEIDSANDLVQMTVDFDVHESFIAADDSGTYIFKPVVRAEGIVVNGENIEVVSAG